MKIPEVPFEEVVVEQAGETADKESLPGLAQAFYERLADPTRLQALYVVRTEDKEGVQVLSVEGELTEDGFRDGGDMEPTNLAFESLADALRPSLRLELNYAYSLPSPDPDARAIQRAQARFGSIPKGLSQQYTLSTPDGERVHFRAGGVGISFPNPIWPATLVWKETLSPDQPSL